MRIKQQQSRERDFSKSLPNVIWRRTAKAPLFCAPVPNLGIRFGSERVSGSSLIWGGGWGAGRKEEGRWGQSSRPSGSSGEKKGWGGAVTTVQAPPGGGPRSQRAPQLPPLQAALPGTGRRGSRAGSRGSARTRTPRPRARPGVAAHVLLVVGATGSPPAPGARAAPPRPAGAQGPRGGRARGGRAASPPALTPPLESPRLPGSRPRPPPGACPPLAPGW